MPLLNQLTLEELRNKAKQILLRDSAKLAGTNYSAYPGKTLAPMSSLTQRAQSLEQKRLAKGMPYLSSLNTIVNSSPQGLTPDNIQAVLNNIRDSHNSFNNNILLSKLNKQYGASLNPYLSNLEKKLKKDTNSKLGELASDIESLNTPLRKLEGKKHRAAFTAISQSAKAKEAREKGLIDDLYNYGEQKQDIINKGLTAEKARFDAEKNDPYIRLQKLQQALNNIGEFKENELPGNPDLNKLNAAQVNQALSAYGIDTSAPVDRWEGLSRSHIPVYKGKLVEPINPTMEMSYKLAEELNPSYKDENYLNRKTIRKSIVNSPESISKTIAALPSQIVPKFQVLNQEAKRKLKADINALNAKYIRQGSYGSQSHMQAIANRTRELNDALLASRGKTVKEDLFKNITANQYSDINKIGQLGQYDQLANSEFSNNLADVKNINLKGLEKWKNNQEHNEQLYKAYQEEKSFQQPRLVNNIVTPTDTNNRIPTIGNYFNNQDIDLSAISNLNNRYNELEKELQTKNKPIESKNDYHVRRGNLEHEKNKQELKNKLFAEHGPVLRMRAFGTLGLKIVGI
jgi:hypothetical protein